tara:strand:- start:1138 stop:1560 length:423 start_codon:yes stop_codon:yes gene_type:complete
MSYKIVSKYIKDLSFEIFDAKSYFLIENNIKNYKFMCDINSKKLKEKIIEVDVNLSLVPSDPKINKGIDVSVKISSVIQVEGEIEKTALEKIVLIEVPTKIYPEIRGIIVFLFEKSGFKKINIDDKIDFEKLYETRKVQK